ncbi:MAG: hypothetical protein K8W52_20620 [Deltaproteobacteria bacterium]|nr:hypothetical protein [Deltaproteobacteria bacterium]
MILIYGTRMYGRVDGYRHQHAATVFAHLWFLPMFPVGSYWIVDGESRGHRIGLAGKSVAAGYLRVWGPLVAVGGVVAGHAGYLVAAAAAGLSAWSWTWTRARAARREKRALMLLVATGTACDPMRMPRDLALAMRRDVEDRWASVAGERSPLDIARLGASSAAQAATAHALLRLVARTSPRAIAAEALAAADQILDATAEVRELPGGPYRAALDLDQVDRRAR